MDKYIVAGKLNKKELDFIRKKNPGLADRIKDNSVIMWDDRRAHIEKHRPNFKRIDDLDKYIGAISDIISKPDFIGIRNSDSSLQFIKQFDDNVLVAVRVTTTGILSVRTMYPITDSQISDYIRKGTAWRYS